jgi:TolA-binding protein
VAATSASAAHVETASAAQLFARANAARRSGDVERALPLYRRLLTEFGASREARTAEVTMARLLLDTQGNATEALGLFQRYQREQPDGTLAEEAVLGEAEALKALGRRADEAAAWSRLVERFPTTVHRARAEARLAEIAPSPP